MPCTHSARLIRLSSLLVGVAIKPEHQCRARWFVSQPYLPILSNRRSVQQHQNPLFHRLFGPKRFFYFSSFFMHIAGFWPCGSRGWARYRGPTFCYSDTVNVTTLPDAIRVRDGVTDAVRVVVVLDIRPEHKLPSHVRAGRSILLARTIRSLDPRQKVAF